MPKESLVSFVFLNPAFLSVLIWWFSKLSGKGDDWI